MNSKCYVITIYGDSGQPLYVRLASGHPNELCLPRDERGHTLFSTRAATYQEASNQAMALLGLCAEAFHGGPRHGVAVLSSYRCIECKSTYAHIDQATACVKCHQCEVDMQALADASGVERKHRALIARGRWPSEIRPEHWTEGPVPREWTTVRWTRLVRHGEDRFVPSFGFDDHEPDDSPPVREEFLHEYLRIQCAFFDAERVRVSRGVT